MADYVSNVRKAGTDTKVPIYSNGYLVQTYTGDQIIEINAATFKVPTIIKVSAGQKLTINSVSALDYEVVIDAAEKSGDNIAEIAFANGITLYKVGSISADDNEKRRLYSFLNGTLAVGALEEETTSVTSTTDE